MEESKEDDLSRSFAFYIFLANFEQQFNVFGKMKVLFLAVMFLIWVVNLDAQTITEGKIKFQIEYLTYSEEIKDNEELKNLMPKGFTLFFKERRSRMEMQDLETGQLVIVSDATSGDVTTLLELPAQKIALEQKGADQKAENEALIKKMTVQTTEENKMIAGRNCKKANIIFFDSSKTVVWFAPDLPACNNQDYPMLGGLLMEYEEEDEAGNKVRVSAVELTSEKVADDKFIVPPGYELVSEEEFIEAMGK